MGRGGVLLDKINEPSNKAQKKKKKKKKKKNTIHLWIVF